MTKAGKLRSKTPKAYDVPEEHSYSRHPDTDFMNETSTGQTCEIDPQLSDDWKKGTHVVERSVLAEKCFAQCVIPDFILRTHWMKLIKDLAVY